MGCKHGNWDGPCGECDVEAGKVGDQRDDEIESLKGRLALAEDSFKVTNEENDRWRKEVAQLRQEKAEALAANAEMRAALTEIIVRGQEQRGTGRMIETAEAVLSRTDLGADMVVVPREVVKETRNSLRVADRLRRLAVKVVCLPRSVADSVEAPADLLQTIDDLNRDEADFVRWEGKLDALLKKGGG